MFPLLSLRRPSIMEAFSLVPMALGGLYLYGLCQKLISLQCSRSNYSEFHFCVPLFLFKYCDYLNGCLFLRSVRGSGVMDPLALTSPHLLGIGGENLVF